MNHFWAPNNYPDLHHLQGVMKSATQIYLNFIFHRRHQKICSCENSECPRHEKGCGDHDGSGQEKNGSFHQARRAHRTESGNYLLVIEQNQVNICLSLNRIRFLFASIKYSWDSLTRIYVTEG